MREIKQRIENVRSTEKIIKAMDTIASSKLHKSRAQLEGARPIFDALKSQIEEIGLNSDAQNNIFYKEREIKSSLYIVLTSDRDFAGAYNSNIMNKALEHMNQKNNAKVITIGSKGYDFFKRKGKNIIRHVKGVSDSAVYYGCDRLATLLLRKYISEEADEIYVGYTKFENILSYRPLVERILPLATELTEKRNYQKQKKYEPDIDTVINHTVPLYIHMNLFRAFSESHTSEQASRMINMDSAGKNAEEIIEDLTKMYNRERQAAITQELSEIVGGSNF